MGPRIVHDNHSANAKGAQQYLPKVSTVFRHGDLGFELMQGRDREISLTRIMTLDSASPSSIVDIRRGWELGVRISETGDPEAGSLFRIRVWMLQEKPE